jgi:hypothetical protein
MMQYGMRGPYNWGCETMKANAVAAVTSAIIASGFLSSSAAADSNIQTLLQECNANSTSYEGFHCVGYVCGIADMMGMNGALFMHSGEGLEGLFALSACYGKPEPTCGAKVQVFRNWAQKHPEKWNIQEYVGVALSLREVWPCR